MQEKLIILRKRHNLTIQFMADYLGISPKQYSHKEKGEYEFKANEMFKLRDLFDCRIEDIFMPRSHQGGDKNKAI